MNRYGKQSGWGGKRPGAGRKKGVRTKTIRVPVDYENELKAYGKALGDMRFATDMEEMKHIRKIHNQVGKAIMDAMFIFVNFKNGGRTDGLFVGSYLGNDPLDDETERYYGCLAMKISWISPVDIINYLDIQKIYSAVVKGSSIYYMRE